MEEGGLEWKQQPRRGWLLDQHRAHLGTNQGRLGHSYSTKTEAEDMEDLLKKLNALGLEFLDSALSFKILNTNRWSGISRHVALRDPTPTALEGWSI